MGTTSHEETEAHGGNMAAPTAATPWWLLARAQDAPLCLARGGHHGRPVVATGRGTLSSLLCCVLVQVCGFCLGWVILGLFCYLL